MSFRAMTVKVNVGLVVPNGMSKEEMEKLFKDYLPFIKNELMSELNTDKVSVEYDGNTLKVKVPRHFPTQSVRTRCVELTKKWMTTKLPNALLVKDTPPTHE